MKRITFGTPEKIVPSKYCKNLKYRETKIKYNIEHQIATLDFTTLDFLSSLDDILFFWNKIFAINQKCPF